MAPLILTARWTWAAKWPVKGRAQAVEKAEIDARSAGEKLGAEYAQNMMAGIDGAQSTEDLINAFEATTMPLDARRDELAGL